MAPYTTQPTLSAFEAAVNAGRSKALPAIPTLNSGFARYTPTVSYTPSSSSYSSYVPSSAPTSRSSSASSVFCAAPASTYASYGASTSASPAVKSSSGFDFDAMSWAFRAPTPYNFADAEAKLATVLRGRRTNANTEPLGYALTWIGHSLSRTKVYTVTKVVLRRPASGELPAHARATAAYLERLLARKATHAIVDSRSTETYLCSVEVVDSRDRLDAAAQAVLRLPQFAGFVHVAFNSESKLKSVAGKKLEAHGMGEREVERVEQLVDGAMGEGRGELGVMKMRQIEWYRRRVEQGDESKEVRNFVKRHPQHFAMSRPLVV
ncbi:hypothetical protein IAT38_001703 [Cryptococcus sp. DSM 104549]